MAVLYIRAIPEDLKKRLEQWALREHRSSSNAAIRLIEMALDELENKEMEKQAACLVGEE